MSAKHTTGNLKRNKIISWAPVDQATDERAPVPSGKQFNLPECDSFLQKLWKLKLLLNFVVFSVFFYYSRT